MYVLYILLCLFSFTESYENIALRKPTWQSTTHDPSYSGSSRAVDGQRTDLSYHGRQCSVSSNTQTTATWWVNLERKRGIIFIVIYYRTENGNWSSTNGFTTRFLGFQVYISNTTDRLKGHLCFHDTNYTISTIPAVVNITCPVHGQYVIYHNERRPGVTYPDDYSKYAYIELCEVEVYGCPDPTHYGSDCSYKCSTNCLQYCDIVSGKCPSCAPGYKGKWCEQVCDDGLFGDGCSLVCGHCKQLTECHPVDGTCLNGCSLGYQGPYCNKTCLDGYYGENCKNACNTTCKGCNRTNGICENGCRTGWTGDFCHEECDGGFYGDNCSMPCGHCISVQQCDPMNGTCLNGCAEGYIGIYCNNSCLKGSFGKNCSETCSSACYDSTCNRTNGRCDNGCYPGWKGDYCNEECNEGFFGENCSHTCGHCKSLEECHPMNGTCLNGCSEGYKGEFCNKACSEGYFGEKCVHKCNDTCKGCNNVNGVCEHGCHTGWKGDFCDEECDYNQYGTACNKTCGNCINSETCHHINGFCVNGCDSGYQGNKCDQVCEFGFYGINCRDVCSTFCKVSRDCHHVTGVCKFGCKAGMTGLDCLRVEDNDMYQARFYGILVPFCVTIVFIGLFLSYKIRNWIKKSQERNNKTYHHQKDDVTLHKIDDFAVENIYDNQQV